jgi:DNA-directed RNA polymerase specialized sigma24 family protein
MILFAGDRGWPAPDADGAVTALYTMHYRSLVRLAALLVPDVATAEQIVQDSFVAMHSAWPSLPDADSALAYIRRSVVSQARSALQDREADLPGVDHESLLFALGALPARQREVVVLRYFADLSEAQIADAVGVSPGTVTALAAEATTALRAKLGG